MKRIRNVLSAILSIIGLCFRKLMGCRIQFAAISLISLGATIHTQGKKASICFGNKCTVRKNTEISTTEGKISLGNNCFVNRNCMIVAHERITIGDGTTIGPGTYIYDHDHNVQGGYVTAPITIGENVWIGAGCIILKGVSIGDGSVVAAGAVVAKNVLSGTVVGGVPAKQIGSVN